MSPAPKRVNAVAHWVTIGLRMREALHAIGQLSTPSSEVRTTSLWRLGDAGEVVKTLDTHLNACSNLDIVAVDLNVPRSSPENGCRFQLPESTHAARGEGGSEGGELARE